MAKWLIYTGQLLSAAKAADIGLVDEVVPHEELDDAAARAIRGAPRWGASTWPVAFAELAGFFEAHPVEDIRLGRADTHGNEHLLKALKQVTTKAPVALRLAEKLIDAGGRGTLEQGLRMELDHLREIFSTADALEGLSALGRRKPKFKGR
jgi:enoyl-CoA hydratase/carnithine racemase